MTRSGQGALGWDRLFPSSYLNFQLSQLLLGAPLNLVISWHEGFEMRQTCELSKFLGTC